MSIQIYILSKLMDGNSYPYELKKQLSAPIPLDRLINITESKLYYHFDSLEKKGLVEPIEIIKEEHRPDKQIFKITDKGRSELPVKIYQELERAETVSETIIGLINLRFVEREKVIAVLEKKLEKIVLRKGDLLEYYGELDLEGEKKVIIDIYNDYFINREESEIHWIEQIIQKLKK